MADTSQTIAGQLALTNPLVDPVNRAAIAALGLPTASRGLDAGCGIGLQAVLLGEAVGPKGRVAGVDLSPTLVAEARARAQAAGLADRLHFEVADVRRLPYGAGAFDWAWSANCVGYGIPEPELAVAELARVVRPGGSVALLVWSSQTLLPGYPRLEARLNATAPGLAPFSPGSPPGRHHLFGLGLLRRAGLVGTQARTFAGQVYAPLSPAQRGALEALLAMRWPGAERELIPEEASLHRRLCEPGSPEFIAGRPDYYACFTETLFWGRVARSGTGMAEGDDRA